MTHDLVIANGTVVTPELGAFEADVAADGDEIAAIASSGTLSGDRVIDAEGKYVLPGAIDPPHTTTGSTAGSKPTPRRSRAPTSSAASRLSGTTSGGAAPTRRSWRATSPRRSRTTTTTTSSRWDCSRSSTSRRFRTSSRSWGLRRSSGTRTTKTSRLRSSAPTRDARRLGGRVHSGARRAGRAHDARPPPPRTWRSRARSATTRTSTPRSVEDQEYRDYDVLVDQFPDYAETQSMTASGSLARQHDYDDSFYAVHISAGRTADELAMLHDAGWDITGETCTHYLTLTAEECDERHNVNPPVRSKEDQETLWEAPSPTARSPVSAPTTARTCATTRSARTCQTASPASPRRRRCSR